MKQLLAAIAALMVFSAVPASAQQACLATVQSVQAQTSAQYPGITIEPVRQFDGADAQKVMIAIDKTVPEDLPDYDKSTNVSVFHVSFMGHENYAAAFYHQEGDKQCLDALVHLDWDAYQMALTLAFGPRA